MPDMLVIAGQTLCAIVAGAMLFVLWRRFSEEQVGVRIVAIGFVARAALGAAMFWVSWLSLPFGRSLQLGRGLWFFALDGQGYTRIADQLIDRGFVAVLIGDRFEAAYVYIQLVAAVKILFGSPVSALLLPNLAAYLAAALVIARWGNESSRRASALLALFGLSFDPTGLLWSTQPLKESIFAFLIVLFVYALWRWLAALEESVDASDLARLVGLLGVLVYLIGGVRWQYGLVVLAVFVPFSLWGAVLQQRDRMRHLAASAAAFATMFFAYALSRPGSFESRFVWFKGLPGWLVRYVQGNREQFRELFPGSSAIEAGGLIDSVPFSDVFARGLMAVLPRFVTDALGLATAQGGRGLWFFAELDTLFFLGFLALVVRHFWRNRPLRLTRKPVLGVLVALLFATLPVLYVVNNFGSLLRYRMMIMLPIVLMPLCAAPQADGAKPFDESPNDEEQD